MAQREAAGATKATLATMGFLTTQHAHLRWWGEGHNPEHGANLESTGEGTGPMSGDTLNRRFANAGFNAEAKEAPTFTQTRARDEHRKLTRVRLKLWGRVQVYTHLRL